MAFWEPSSFGMMRDRFAAQFDTEGSRLVYRENSKGPAFAVSEAERDKFYAEYDRYLSRFRWTMLAWTLPTIVLAIGVLVWLDPRDGPFTYLIIIAAIVPGTIATIRSGRRATAAPMRLLARRTPISPALSPEAARRAGFRRMSWSVFLVAPVYCGFMAYKYHLEKSPFSADHIFWTLFICAILVLVAVQAFRKWRTESSDKRASQ